MKLKMFKISIIAIIVILTTTFIFIGKINSSKNNLSKNSTSNTESKEKVKQKDIPKKAENQKELPKEKNESVDVVESPKEDIKENKVSSNTSTTSTTSKIIEIETSIKLLEYLKRNNTIDDGMYNFCINKLLHKIEFEKQKQDDKYINDLNNYKLLT